MPDVTLCSQRGAAVAVGDDHKTAVVEAGGLPLIPLVKAMTEFPKSEEVQEFGCCALGELAVDDAGRKAVLEAGGLAAIKKAMEKCPGDKDVLMLLRSSAHGRYAGLSHATYGCMLYATCGSSACVRKQYTNDMYKLLPTVMHRSTWSHFSHRVKMTRRSLSVTPT
jgi:hypothetical protein